MQVVKLQANVTKKQRSFYPWLVWGLGAAFFFAEYFARVSPSVMVPQLMSSFHIMALGIGSLSAFFYYAYVSMQVPVGTLVDRYGPHRLLTVTAGLCAIGCFLFATSHNIYTAQLARFIMGFGAAFAFVGTLKLATLWFPPKRFGLLAGLTQAIGMLGVAVALSSLAITVSIIGWRETLWLIGAVLLLLAILIGLFVRDRPATLNTQIHVSSGLWASLVIVLKNRQSWINAAYAGFIYAPTAAFAELWGVSFLIKTYGFSTEMAATAVSCIFYGWAIGGPIMGWISDVMHRRRPIMLISIVASFICMSLVLYLPDMSAPLLFILLFLYGISNTGLAVSYAVASEINPRRVAGTSIAFSNMASVLIGAAFQPIIGWFLDLQWHGRMINNVPVYSAHAFRMALIALPLCLILGFVAALFVRETNCQIVAE